MKQRLAGNTTDCMQAVLSNWGQEFAKWAPDMAVVMYDGSPDERKQLQKEQVEKGTFNVLITHYDLVMRDKAALRKVVCPCLASLLPFAFCLPPIAQVYFALCDASSSFENNTPSVLLYL